MRRPVAVLALLLCCLTGASGAVAWTGPFDERVPRNPADALASLPIEAPRYDRARGCTRSTPAPGAASLARWLGRTTRGSSWGVVRCERWGKGSASLHAEGRALDWHLDAGDRADRAAARKLIAKLLAPDRRGRPAALARRMGIQEIIWDCQAWFGGASQLHRYSACRRGVDRTTAHRDHVHLGLTKDGAAKRTSFWTRRSPALAKRDLSPLPGAEELLERVEEEGTRPVEELAEELLEPVLGGGSAPAGP